VSETRRLRRPARIAVAVALLVIAALVLWFEPITGPHVMHLFGQHGIDGGDLLAVPFVALAAWVWWRN
jgi:hypothetical protein